MQPRGNKFQKSCDGSANVGKRGVGRSRGIRDPRLVKIRDGYQEMPADETGPVRRESRLNSGCRQDCLPRKAVHYATPNPNLRAPRIK